MVVPAKGMQAKLLEAYRASPNGLTDEEAATVAGLPIGAWKRCSELRTKDVKFLMEPTVINPTTRICFIEAPDGVSVELLERKD
jgi:hypothetical protein